MNAARLELLAGLLDASPAEVTDAVQSAGAGGAFLARAVLTGRIPTLGEVSADLLALLSDPTAALAALSRSAPRAVRRGSAEAPLVTAGLVVDVTDTASSPFTTGIQRVARSLIAEWSRDREVLPVVWRRDGSLAVADAEGAVRAGAVPSAQAGRAVVPFGASFVLPEIATDRRRAARIAALAAHGARRSLAIGHDCIPVTTAEASPPGMSGAFADYLAALARFDVVAATSGASHTEFAGWASMLPAAGLAGPEVRAVPLPVTPLAAEPEPEASIRAALGIGPDPVVLVVGSREPRKNHATILTAAELAWRSGARFELVLAGGRSWDSADADAVLDLLRAAGRPVQVLVGADDARLAGCYRMATYTVFASRNEGFGLPVAESLAAGTPVITADFGSQAEIASHGGAVLVDPTDPRAIAAAMTGLLDDPARLAVLTAECARVPTSDWAAYASGVAALL